MIIGLNKITYGATLEVIVACMKASPTALYPQERVKILGQVIIRQQDMRTTVA